MTRVALAGAGTMGAGFVRLFDDAGTHFASVPFFP